LAFRAIPGVNMSWVVVWTIAIMTVTVIVAVLLYRTYDGALAQALSRPDLSARDTSRADRSSLAAVGRLLDSPKAQEVRLALDVLEQAEHPSLDGRLVALTGHPAAAVREDVYGRIERLQVRAALSAVSARMATEKPARVRAAALRAFCALADDSLEVVAPHLAEGDVEIRLAGMTGLLRYGGISGALLLGKRLNVLLQSSEPADRLFVARLVGEVGSPTFYRPLLTLLTDPSPDIRNAALASAGQVAHPRLLPLVVGNLAHIPCRSTALAALVSFGPALLPTVDAALHGRSDHSEDTVLRLLRVCGQIRGEAVVATLTEHRGQVEKGRRYEVLRALFLCGYQAVGEERAAVKEQVLGEARHAVRVLLAREEMGQDSELAVLQSTLDDDVEATLRRTFLLLSFLYDARRIKSAEERLAEGDARQRSLALELLDNTLRGEVRACVAGLAREKLSPGKHLERLRRRFSLERMDAQSRIREIIANPEVWPDSWIRTCAVYVAGRLNRQDLASVIAESGSWAWPPEPAVASWALRTLAPEVHDGYALESVPDVAEVCREVQQWGRGERGEGDGSMLLNIEKVVLLKSVGVFAHTADSALASVASIVEPVEVTAGEPIIGKGDMESCLYLIVRGRVRVHDGSRDIARLGQGEVIGEMAMLDPAPRSASVTAVEDGLLFRIEKEAFDAVMADNPEVVQGVIRVLCRRLRKEIGALE
jgi:hypothetical protein